MNSLNSSQRRLLEALRQLKTDKHHNLDIHTIRKIDELIFLLSKNVNSQKDKKAIFLLLGVVLGKLPKYIELLENILGE